MKKDFLNKRSYNYSGVSLKNRICIHISSKTRVVSWTICFCISTYPYFIELKKYRFLPVFYNIFGHYIRWTQNNKLIKTAVTSIAVKLLQSLFKNLFLISETQGLPFNSGLQNFFFEHNFTEKIKNPLRVCYDCLVLMRLKNRQCTGDSKSKVSVSITILVFEWAPLLARTWHGVAGKQRVDNNLFGLPLYFIFPRVLC